MPSEMRQLSKKVCLIKVWPNIIFTHPSTHSHIITYNWLEYFPSQVSPVRTIQNRAGHVRIMAYMGHILHGSHCSKHFTYIHKFGLHATYVLVSQSYYNKLL